MGLSEIVLSRKHTQCVAGCKGEGRKETNVYRRADCQMWGLLVKLVWVWVVNSYGRLGGLNGWMIVIELQPPTICDGGICNYFDALDSVSSNINGS
jgi:hypothetical protein